MFTDILLVVASIYVIYRGIRLLRGAPLKRNSWEYRKVLARVNSLNMLRRRPDQQSLTKQQMIDYGKFSVVIGAIALLLGIADVIWHGR